MPVKDDKDDTYKISTIIDGQTVKIETYEDEGEYRANVYVGDNENEGISDFEMSFEDEPTDSELERKAMRLYALENPGSFGLRPDIEEEI